MLDILIEALSTKTFGRNVLGCDSDSDLEAPNIFIKCSILLDGMSNNEFAYVLGRMEFVMFTKLQGFVPLHQKRQSNPMMSKVMILD